MTTATTKQIDYINNLREEGYNPTAQQVETNIAALAEALTNRVADIQQTRAFLAAKAAGKVTKENRKTIRAELREQNQVTAEQAEAQANEWARELVGAEAKARNHAMTVDPATLTKAEASEVIDELNAPAGLLAINIDTILQLQLTSIVSELKKR